MPGPGKNKSSKQRNSRPPKKSALKTAKTTLQKRNSIWNGSPDKFIEEEDEKSHSDDVDVNKVSIVEPDKYLLQNNKGTHRNE